jgi:hypothetical protein
MDQQRRGLLAKLYMCSTHNETHMINDSGPKLSGFGPGEDIENALLTG